MKLRKIALRGLTAVIVAAALCMFFSGTIENITTPKVRIVRASRGKLTEKLELSASLAYPETEEQRLSLPAGQTLTITRVNVRAGYPVSEGDVVLEAAVTGYEAAVEAARSEYDAALDELMEVERKNDGVTLRRSEQEYADSYAALRAAAREAARKRTDMDVLLRAAGLTYASEGYPAGADEDVQAAIDAWREAAATQEAAQAAFDRAARYGVDETAWAYITARQTAQEKLSDCADKLVELEELNRTAGEIRAPHDGVIASVPLKAGDTYDGTTALYAITADGTAPALRAELTDVEQTVAEGMEVQLPGGAVAEITGIGYTETGARCADVAVIDRILKTEGSMYSLSMNPTKLILYFTAKEKTCLLPSSAVRGSGDSRFVYVVNERNTAFGQKKLSISKLPVTVIAEADGTASVEEDLSYYDVAYMEDRALADGSDVMRYAE